MYFTQITSFPVVLTDQPFEVFNAAFLPRQIGLAKVSLGTSAALTSACFEILKSRREKTDLTEPQAQSIIKRIQSVLD